MTINEINNKIESINEQINALNAQKSALNNEIERIIKEEQTADYKAIENMVENYNKKYNSNLTIAKYYEAKTEDYPDDILSKFFRPWEDI